MLLHLHLAYLQILVWAGWIGCVGIDCAGGTISCTGRAGGMTMGGCSAGSVGGPPSAMFSSM